MSLTTVNHHRIAQALTEAVRADETLYAILDAARHSDVPYLLKWAGVEHECLYEGETREKLWYVAPYLLKCDPASDFFKQLLEDGWGKSWGIFLTSSSKLDELLTHFRQFLLVKDEDNKDFYFRFYDPRVLRVYLPTCTAEEVREFFGTNGAYLLEAAEPDTLLKFTAGERGAERAVISVSATEDAHA